MNLQSLSNEVDSRDEGRSRNEVDSRRLRTKTHFWPSVSDHHSAMVITEGVRGASTQQYDSTTVRVTSSYIAAHECKPATSRARHPSQCPRLSPRWRAFRSRRSLGEPTPSRRRLSFQPLRCGVLRRRWCWFSAGRDDCSAARRPMRSSRARPSSTRLACTSRASSRS